jgi:threonyl-tRNA synthetase
MLIVGEKEEADNAVSVRQHGKGDQGTLRIQDFIDSINTEIKNMLSV